MTPYRAFLGKVERLDGFMPPWRLIVMLSSIGLLAMGAAVSNRIYGSHPPAPFVEGVCRDEVEIGAGSHTCTHSQHKMKTYFHPNSGAMVVDCVCEGRGKEP